MSVLGDGDDRQGYFQTPALRRRLCFSLLKIPTGDTAVACYLCPYGSATSPLQVSERTHHACAFARPRGRSPRLPFPGSRASPYRAGVLGDGH